MKKYNNERGIALASVLILTTLLAILASTILHLAYLSYERKLTEKRNTENFYCAEAVIDTIKAVIQNSAAQAIPDAEKSTADFVQAAYTAITGNTNKVQAGDHFPGSVIRAYLFDRVCYKDGLGTDERYDTNYYGTNDDGSKISTMVYNALTQQEASANPDNQPNPNANGGSFNVGEVYIRSDCIEITGVEITYVNDLGYKASIKTDIVIRAPKYIKPEDAPLGSYSMFAGCGAVIKSTASMDQAKALNNLLYMHQEGNVYYGSMTGNAEPFSCVVGGDISSEGKLSIDYRATTIASFSGTNIVFNGDLVIADGSSAIFTGGDGTSKAVIQVNGYIVLDKYSKLFIAPNVYINCKGILTEMPEYKKNGSVYEKDENGAYILTNTPAQYSGDKYTDNVSQFYPYTKNKAESLNNAKAMSYYNGDIEIIDYLQSMGNQLKSVDGDNDVDSSFSDAIYKKSGAEQGVYILNCTWNKDTGWGDRTNSSYQKLYKDLGGNWKKYVGDTTVPNIYTNSVDYNLNAIEKVSYNGNSYDAEFFRLTNMPLLATYPSFGFDTQSGITLSKKLLNYSYDANSFTPKNWSYAKSNYSSLNISDDNWDLLKTLGYLDRSFILPNDVSGGGTPNFSSFNVKTSYSSTNFTFGSATFQANALNSITSNALHFVFSIDSAKGLEVHATGTFAGIFLSPYKVVYGASTSVTRMISLLELSKSIEYSNPEYASLENSNNDVHKLLNEIGSCYLLRNASQNMYDNLELDLIDNVFNGGMKIFWMMGSSGDGGPDDNSNRDLIDLENWQKK